MSRLENYHTLMNNLYFNVITQGYATLGQYWNHVGTCDCFNRLYIVIDGQGEIVHKGKKIPLVRGNAYLLPQFESYDLHCDDHLTKIWISFNIGLVKGHDFFHKTSDTVVLKIDEDKLEKLAEHIESHNLCELIWCQGEIFQLVSRALLEGEAIYSHDLILLNKYERLFDYIRRNLGFKMDLAGVAEIMQMSEYSLAKQFRKDMGMTIKEYIQQQLINELCRKLIMTEDTVAEIADQFGFKDPFYFSRFFKKNIGIAPTHYRAHYHV